MAPPRAFAGPRARSAERGASLIELIIVVSILGILLMAAIPNISERIRNAQIRTAAESLQAGLLRARNEAITKNASVRFSLVTTLGEDCARSATATNYVVSFDDPAGQCDTDAGKLSEAPRIFVKASGKDGSAAAALQATQADYTTAANQIVYTALGRLDSTVTGQIRRIEVSAATNPSAFRRYRIEVSPVGGVRICEPTITSTTDPRRCLT